MNGKNPSASFDYSGNRNHGVVANNASIKPDNTKGQFAFDFYSSSNQYVSVPTLDMRNLTQFSWSAWIRNTRVTANNTIFFSSSSSGGSEYLYDNFIFFRNVSTGRARTAVDNNSDAYGDGGVFPNGVWNHAAVVFDGNGSTNSERLRYFLNGEEVSMTYNYTVPSVTPNRATTNVLIGGYAYNLNASGAMDGQQDDIRVFKRTLTPIEIKHLASKRGVLGSPRQPYDPLKRTVVRVPAAIPAATKVGSIKKPTTIIKPSYQSGYARNASESENPKLWDGLVGAWMPSLGVTGKRIRDVVGNNHATLVDDHPSISNWTTSKVSRSFRFERTDSFLSDYASSSRALGISGTGSWSIHMRVKVDSAATNIYGWLFWVGGSSNSNNRLLSIRTFTDGKYGVAHWYNDLSFAPINYDNWEQIAVTFDGSTERFYLNGAEVLSRTTSLNIADGRLWFNGRGSSQQPTEYEMSSTFVYDRVLSSTEIKQLQVDSLAPFRRKQRVSVAVPAAVPTPSATYHPLRSLAHPLEQ
jgi:hypothetical protein